MEKALENARVGGELWCAVSASRDLAQLALEAWHPVALSRTGAQPVRGAVQLDSCPFPNFSCDLSPNGTEGKARVELRLVYAHWGTNCPPDLWLLAFWSQVSSTGGGTGVDTVLVLMSPMMLSASLSAWYMRSMSSRR